jgi:glycosyltransferase involved in cell wall biosynthesis
MTGGSQAEHCGDAANALVSVIVPVFNCEPFLAEALRSAITQDYRPLEIIVIDDGSTDGSVAVASSFPEVRLLRQENLGCSSARNAGMAQARGEVISLLDADDIWLPGKLACEMRHFADHPKAGYTVCHQRVFVSPGEIAPPWLKPHHCEKTLSQATCCLSIRRSVLETVGGFNIDCRMGEDLDWFLRASEAGIEKGILDPVFVLHRVHSSSLTADIVGTRRALLDVARLSLSRRRARSSP